MYYFYCLLKMFVLVFFVLKLYYQSSMFKFILNLQYLRLIFMSFIFDVCSNCLFQVWLGMVPSVTIYTSYLFNEITWIYLYFQQDAISIIH